jgi:hypothetical protein
VGLDDAFGDVEAKARVGAGAAAARPVAVEDAGDGLDGDARAVVGDEEGDLVDGARGAEDELAALGGELDGVADEVREDLLDAVTIAADEREPGGDAGVDRDGLLRGERREEVLGLGEERGGIVIGRPRCWRRRGGRG